MRNYDLPPYYIRTLEEQKDQNIIIPLFPSIISIQTLDIDSSEIRKLKDVEMKLTNVPTSDRCYTSTTNILKKFPEFKHYFIEALSDLSERILGFRNYDYDISTSWVTRVDQNGESQFHNHRNSYYSGIFYFDDIDKENGGWLQLINQGLQKNDFYLGAIKDEDTTVFNTDSYGIIPHRNMFVLLPSFIQHRVTRYYGENPRFSLAMNFVPKPPYGNADSAILK